MPSPAMAVRKDLDIVGQFLVLEGLHLVSGGALSAQIAEKRGKRFGTACLD